ncbi:MAG: VOC family protein [Acidimicrobiia bacterium]
MIRENPPVGAPIWVDLMAADKKGAETFYTSLFGWTAEAPNEEFGGYQNFLLDRERVAGLMARGDDPPMDFWSVYLNVANADATVASAEANGGAVFLGPHPVGELGTMAIVADPGGAAIGLWQPGTHRGGVVGTGAAPCHFELHTRDLDKVVPFYRDVFGMDFEVTEAGDFRYALYDLGPGFGAGIMDASQWLPDGVPSTWSVYFASADVDASIDAAVGLGASIVQPAEDTPYGRLATLAAPGGAIFKLRGETTPA